MSERTDHLLVRVSDTDALVRTLTDLEVDAVYDVADYPWTNLPRWADRAKPAWVVLATRADPARLVAAFGDVLEVRAEGIDPEHGWAVVLHDDQGRWEWPDARVLDLLGVDASCGRFELGIPWLEMLDQALVPIPSGVHAASELG